MERHSPADAARKGMGRYLCAHNGDASTGGLMIRESLKPVPVLDVVVEDHVMTIDGVSMKRKRNRNV